jgi:Icc-related predicted phosphoesterase
MHILVLSDIHGRVKSLEKIVRLIHNKRVKLVLILGDLTNLGGKKQAEEALKALEGFEVMAIAGNFDTGEVANFLEEKGLSLHGRKKKVGQWAFAGFGGGLLGHPGQYLFSEEEVGKGLGNVLGKGRKGERTGKGLGKQGKTILVTHLPPFGTGIDKCYSGAHIGSKSVRKAIVEFKPALHICGHCHEAAGEEKVGDTVSINIGAVSEGKALLLSLGEKLEWEKIQV